MKTVRIKIENATSSGNRRGFTKHVTSIDSGATNGYAFEGNFLNDREYDLPLGAVVIQKNPFGSARSGSDVAVCYRVTEDGLERVHEETYDWRRDFLTFRDVVGREIVKVKNGARLPSVGDVWMSKLVPIIRTVKLVDDIYAAGEDSFGNAFFAKRYEMSVGWKLMSDINDGDKQ